MRTAYTRTSDAGRAPDHPHRDRAARGARTAAGRGRAMSLDFRQSAALRTLLVRLDAEGPAAWRNDHEAAELMRFTMEKYGALARKHRLDPEDAATAAFEVMRTSAVRHAEDPWAVVTRAVQITLIAEERANGLLCSVGRARRASGLGCHDAERFSDREIAVYEYHPAFHVAPEQDLVEIDLGNSQNDKEEVTGAYHALDKAVKVFVALGWPRDTARSALEYICARLIEARDRPNAHEYLRRDHHARAFLDLDRRAWATLLRVVLGSPNPALAHSDVGHGLLMRILIGEQPMELLQDDDLVLAISSAAARVVRRSHV